MSADMAELVAVVCLPCRGLFDPDDFLAHLADVEHHTLDRPIPTST